MASFEPRREDRVRAPVHRLTYVHEGKKKRVAEETDPFKCALVAPHRTRTKSAAHA